ncbi:nitrite reductase large subunit NirB [Alkalicoccus halolimnae]|uniref:Nitrite reductase large subunit NirB n=1 Tax=Alkalicoccus halolimnae TaxID=1667239 RepID=A0A5C7FJ91_9BACI|nr:nitrite reductase large subunit NirB [Alkalicoccus halolimnae]TXF84626.1 NAD(P)/FAD-dependent oxidoreductase [Alkalicoccus halolimnae]
MNKKKLVLIGNGMAGMNTVEKVVEADPDAFEITVFGKENHPNYNRIMLSSILQGNTKFEDISIHSHSWYDDNNVRLHTGEEVVTIDKENKKVVTDKGREVFYDKLIIATGSNPFILPVPGTEKEEVLPFRTLEHCRYMIESAGRFKKAVVIGGGLLGLEAARGLLNLGLEVDVVHLGKHLMDRQLDETGARLLQKDLEEQGMNFLLEKKTSKITGNDKVEHVHFSDGTRVETDMVVMSVGVSPNIGVAEENGIETSRGILVNDKMETKVKDIFAVGECAEHEGITYGLVSPLYEQADVLAEQLTGNGGSVYNGSLLYTQLKISGIDVFLAGNLQESEKTDTVQLYDAINRVYKKLIIADDVIQGAVLYGDVKQQTKVLSFISNQKIISEKEMQGIVFAGEEENIVQSLSPHAHICQCNSVSKEEIICSVNENNLKTTEEIKEQTKASSSCGGCKPMVAELLAYINSDDFNEYTKKQSLCACTNKTEEEIVEDIQLRQLKTSREVREEPGWTNREGCEICLPALRYYTNIIFMEEQAENFLSAAVIEEEEGTCALTLQTEGGEVTPDLLNKASAAAEKFGIPSMQLTPGQRLRFSGVKKEMAADLVREFNMDFLPADYYTLEPVQTLPSRGSVKDNRSAVLQVAASLEKQLLYVPTPWFVKLRIGASAEEISEVKRSAVGLMQVEKGWEMYIDGELLCTAQTEETVIRQFRVLFQYYRESAKFREEITAWATRVSFIHIREVLFDIEVSDILSERLTKEAGQRDKWTAAVV